jgi:hypothetical protein
LAPGHNIFHFFPGTDHLVCREIIVRVSDGDGGKQALVIGNFDNISKYVGINDTLVFDTSAKAAYFS